MVLDKTKEGIRPRYLIYDIVQFEVCYLQEPAEEGQYLFPSTPSLYTFPPPQGSSEVAQCDHKRRLLCVQKELIEPRDAAVSNKSTLGPYPFLWTYPACTYSERASLYELWLVFCIHGIIYTLAIFSQGRGAWGQGKSWTKGLTCMTLTCSHSSCAQEPGNGVTHASLEGLKGCSPRGKFCRWQADTFMKGERNSTSLFS